MHLNKVTTPHSLDLYTSALRIASVLKQLSCEGQTQLGTQSSQINYPHSTLVYVWSSWMFNPTPAALSSS